MVRVVRGRISPIFNPHLLQLLSCMSIKKKSTNSFIFVQNSLSKFFLVFVKTFYFAYFSSPLPKFFDNLAILLSRGSQHFSLQFSPSTIFEKCVFLMHHRTSLFFHNPLIALPLFFMVWNIIIVP